MTRRWPEVAAAVVLWLWAPPAAADPPAGSAGRSATLAAGSTGGIEPLPAEPTGRVETLPAEPGPHRIWIGDLVLRRSALWDGDAPRFLGMVNGGFGVVAPVISRARGEIYLPETHYARHTRGERTDVVTIFDARTLQVTGEVVIPPRRADWVGGVATAALLDAGRFLVVFNLSPATSVSVVDVETRRFVGEIATPGCTLVYPAGGRRFAMLCGDGTLLTVSLDAEGREAARVQSARFFDPVDDPVTEKGVRTGDRWWFVSFSGRVHPVDVSGSAAEPGEPWSLFDDAQREAGWRVGGHQHLAAHAASGRLYALVHRGGPGSHKDPGREVWVYDTERRERVQTIAVGNLTARFLAQTMEMEGGLAAWLLERLVPDAGAESIAVTQDAAPRLFMASRQVGTVAVYDALSGEPLHDLPQTGIATGVMVVP